MRTKSATPMSTPSSASPSRCSATNCVPGGPSPFGADQPAAAAPGRPDRRTSWGCRSRPAGPWTRPRSTCPSLLSDLEIMLRIHTNGELSFFGPADLRRPASIVDRHRSSCEVFINVLRNAVAGRRPTASAGSVRADRVRASQPHPYGSRSRPSPGDLGGRPGEAVPAFRADQAGQQRAPARVSAWPSAGSSCR